MPYEIKPRVPEVPELPKTQKIYIDGLECGECEPSLDRNELRWHAVIRLRGKTLIGTCFLVQGFGNNPEIAMADGILRARKEQREIAERMEWLEKQLGTFGSSDDRICKAFGTLGE